MKSFTREVSKPDVKSSDIETSISPESEPLEVPKPDTNKNKKNKSVASMLVAQGVPMKQIQLWMGHSTFSTTADIYAHLSTDMLEESADCISALLSEPGKDVKESVPV